MENIVRIQKIHIHNIIVIDLYCEECKCSSFYHDDNILDKIGLAEGISCLICNCINHYSQEDINSISIGDQDLRY